MPGKRKKIKSRAFTLIELLLGFSILAFALCGILLTYLNMFLMSDLARDFTLANNAAQRKMEDLRAGAFDSIVSFQESFDANGVFQSEAGYDANSKKGMVTALVDSATGFSDLKKVRMLVCFKSRQRLIGDSFTDCSASPAELLTFVSR
jgi:type II secretory pathway pseudopilin PulG